MVRDVVLGLGPWLSLRIKLESLVLALALNVESLVLALALRLESLLTSLDISCETQCLLFISLVYVVLLYKLSISRAHETIYGPGIKLDHSKNILDRKCTLWERQTSTGYRHNAR